MRVHNLRIHLRISWSVCRHKTSFSSAPWIQQARCCRCIHTNTQLGIHFDIRSVFHMHPIMNTYCPCLQEGAPGWTRVAPSPTRIRAVSRKPSAALSSLTHTTQCSSLYTTAITQGYLTLAMSIYPSAHSRWCRQPNYNNRDLPAMH